MSGDGMLRPSAKFIRGLSERSDEAEKRRRVGICAIQVGAAGLRVMRSLRTMY